MSIQKTIGFTVQFRGTVPEAVQKLTEELKKRSFGVLSNIDVQKIIKEKLGEDMDGYVILDVCNPKHAKRALDAHKEVGLILPCKITIFENGDSVWISLYKPTEAIAVLGFEDLKPLAEEVEKELSSAIMSVSS
jgi:uncharacterized protein (DUF302 family)